MEVEKLDIGNVIEINLIRERLVNEPDLLSMFELLCIMVNNRLNKEEVTTNNLEVEDDAELLLSDHESDED
tara:strand:- start:802 stop:1014 length:213 start_codon:yes stop_codon:yes gene_type:complete